MTTDPIPRLRRLLEELRLALPYTCAGLGFGFDDPDEDGFVKVYWWEEAGPLGGRTRVWTGDSDGEIRAAVGKRLRDWRRDVPCGAAA